MGIKASVSCLVWCRGLCLWNRIMYLLLHLSDYILQHPYSGIKLCLDNTELSYWKQSYRSVYCRPLFILTSMQMELYCNTDWVQDTQFYLTWLQYLLFLKSELYSHSGPTLPAQDTQQLIDEHLQCSYTEQSDTYLSKFVLLYSSFTLLLFLSYEREN
jgi:hypothetical protein